MNFETDLETSSYGKLAHQKAISRAHLAFIINCFWETAFPSNTPSAAQALTPNLRPVISPVKTYILFCGESQPHLTQEGPLDGWPLA